MGLSTTPMDGRTVIFKDLFIKNSEDVFRKLGPTTWAALQEFDIRSKEWMSPEQFYDSDWREGDSNPLMNENFHSVLAQIPDVAARRYIQTMVHSDLATEPHQTSASYGLQNYLMNDPSYMRLYTIDEGLERIPEELSQRIRATILLNRPILCVERSTKDLLRVVSRSEGRIEVDEYDFVVAALPNNWLPAIEWGGELLAKAMHEHHVAYDYPALPSGQHPIPETLLARSHRRVLLHVGCLRRLLLVR